MTDLFREYKMKMVKLFVVSLIPFICNSCCFICGNCCYASTVAQREHLLNNIDSFLIGQMQVVDPARPTGQPPMTQTYGWNPDSLYIQNDSIGRSQNLPYRGDIYDLSVAVCYFVSRSKTDPNCLDLARQLLDTIIFLQDHDSIPDGRTHAAVWSNNLLDLQGQYSSIFDPDIGTGNLSWQGIALTRYYHALPPNQKDPKYLNAAINTGQWILDNCKRGDPNDYPDDPGGFSGGLLGWSYNPASWKGTEHNIDVYCFASNLYSLTGDDKWREMAQHAQKFIKAMFDPNIGFYYTGTLGDGVTVNPSPIPADAQSWPFLAMIDDCNKMIQALNWLAVPGLNHNDPDDLLVQDVVGEQVYLGIKFSDQGEHVQSEMTACAAMACFLAGRSDDGEELLDNLDLIRLYGAPMDDGIDDTTGLAATPLPSGAPTGFNNVYPNLLHVASSAWTGCAALVSQSDKLANPLRPLPVCGDFSGDGQTNLSDFSLFNSYWLRDDCQLPYWCDKLDVNQDGSVDLGDLDSVVHYWLVSGNL